MAVAGRHIRHDWQTFLDRDQLTVRTECGKTSGGHLAGIPGVTEQPEVVEYKGKLVFGWCTMCCVRAYARLQMVYGEAVRRPLHPYILPMYDGVGEILTPVVNKYKQRQEEVRARHREVVRQREV